MPTPPLEIAVSVASEGWPEGLGPVAERAVLAALDEAEVRFSGPAEISILLTSDTEQRRLNHRWRGLDAPTNVLSFPQLPPFVALAGLVGDLSLARETLEREATALDKDFVEHFSHLVVHGTLHLLGHDHVEDDEALVMEGLETQILAKLGIADPYADG